MRVISFEHGGQVSVGIVVDGGVVEVPSYLDGSPMTVRELLHDGRLDELRALTTRDADFRLDEIRLLPPIPDPGKIICIGLNYRSHRDETGRAESPYPAVFTRFADTQVAHGDPLVRPSVSDRLDYEGELAVVIGAHAWRVDAVDAMAHVAGVSCYNDGSIRDFQRHTSQFIPGKNFPGTGAFGPWLVTLDEVGPIGDLVLTTRVNGDVRQKASLSDLIFDIPTLIAYVSSFTALDPGDVIVTGTPAGVGLFREPPSFLAAGDVVEVEISGVGVLRNEVVEEVV